MKVLVLGGTGFIGSHAARALRARGHTVVIGTRYPRRALFRLPPDEARTAQDHYSHVSILR